MKLINILLLTVSTILTSNGEKLKYPQRTRDESVKAVYIIYPKAFVKSAQQLKLSVASSLKTKLIEDIDAVKGRAMGLREKYKNAAVVIIGNLEQNQALLQLYAKFMTNADALTPGKDGILIQQIPNRNIPGSHATIIAGSSVETTRLAVKKYIAARKPFSIELYDFKAGVPLKYKKGLIRNVRKRMNPEKSWRNFYYLSEAFRLTADKKYLVIARLSAEKMTLIKDNHYGMGLPLRGWDYWARSEQFPGELVQKVDQLFLDYLVNEQQSWWRRKEAKAVFADNRHHVYGTWGYYQAALMLYRGLDTKQRDTATGRFIKEKITECEQWFAACCREYTPSVLSLGAFINLNVFSLYSLQSGDVELFKSGRAAQYVRLAAVATDNTGCSIGISGYEDTYPGMWLNPYPIGGIINATAYYYSSGQDVWLKKNMVGYSNKTWWLLSSDNHSYSCDEIKAVPASDLLGFSSVFSNKNYPLYTGFRTGFKKDDLSFCITGSGTDDINTGDSGKGRQVYPNMIPRLSWNGVSWFVQNTNFVTPGARNALTVDCSTGNKQILNDMKTIFTGQDKENYFYSALAAQYCGSDWKRSFIVCGNDFMLVEDKVTALESGEISCALTWRSPYTATQSDDNTVKIVFNGKQLNMQTIGSAINIDYFGKQGSLSPYIIQQKLAGSLKKGESIVQVNLIYPGERRYEIKALGQGRYILKNIKTAALTLLDFDKFKCTDVSKQPALWTKTVKKEVVHIAEKLTSPNKIWQFNKFTKSFPLLSGYKFSSPDAANLNMAFDGNIKRYKRATWVRGKKLDITIEFPENVNLRQAAMLYSSDGGRAKRYKKLPETVKPVQVNNLNTKVKTKTVPYFELDETYKGKTFTYTGALAEVNTLGKKFRIKADAKSLYQMKLYGGKQTMPKIVDAIMFAKDKLLVRNIKNEIACLSLNTGKCLWQTQIPFEIISWTAGRKNIALGCLDSTVKGLDPDNGKILWDTDTSVIPLGMPYDIAPMKAGFILSTYYHMNPIEADGKLQDVKQKILPGMWLYNVMGKVDLDGDGVPDAISRALWGHVNLYDGKTGKVDYFANLRGRLVDWKLLKGSDNKPDLLIVCRDGIGLYDAHLRRELLHAGWNGAPDEDALLLEKRSQREVWSKKFNSAIESFAKFDNELVLGFSTGMLRRFALSGEELPAIYTGGSILDISLLGDKLLVNSGKELSLYDHNYKLLKSYSLKNNGIKVFNKGQYILAFTKNSVIRIKL